MVDIVSKNGNLLLNVGPKADGTISDEDTAVLKEIGRWLKVNGEAIYNSECTEHMEKGLHKLLKVSFLMGRRKITRAKIYALLFQTDIYAIALKQSDNGEYCIKTFAEQNASRLANFHGIIDDITVLGYDEKPAWERNEKGLLIKTDFKSEYPMTFRLKLK